MISATASSELTVAEIANPKRQKIGSWWDRKGENAIDIIAADDLSRRVVFYEVKRQAHELDLFLLRRKAQRFMEATGQYADYDVSFQGLSMADM